MAHTITALDDVLLSISNEVKATTDINITTDGAVARILKLRPAADGGRVKVPFHVDGSAFSMGGISFGPGHAGEQVTVVIVELYLKSGAGPVPESSVTSDNVKTVLKAASSVPVVSITAYGGRSQKLSPSVVFNMSLENSSASSGGGVEHKCGFFHPDSGRPSLSGCSTRGSPAALECSCDHTTAFSVFLSYEKVVLAPEVEVRSLFLSAAVFFQHRCVFTFCFFVTTFSV